MGFNKRFVSIDNVNDFLEKNMPLQNLFKSDAIICMDKQSSYVFELFQKHLTDLEIKVKLKTQNG